MFLNTLKFNQKKFLALNVAGFLSLLLVSVVLFGVQTKTALAAVAPAITLKAADKDFPVNNLDFKSWKEGGAATTKFVSFEPEKNAKNYILDAIGVQKSTTTHLAFQNYNTQEIYQYLKSIESLINQDSHDATFKLDGDRVTEFDPGTNGQDLDIKSSIEAIAVALDKNLDEVALVTNQTLPNNKLSDTNNLGINELIASGDSNFSGSPANRIFNIKVGVEKEKGVLLKPGEEFSFNKYLGPVDGEHGFKPELVIKKEGTVPEFGGGLCQVSSTAFRAAMNAGLPITARRNHSYAVQYYAPQGTDATIYPGVQDMKFINDTNGNILIWPTFPTKNALRFSIYGVKDQRKVAFEGPTVYDRKSDGSMKATWTRLVTMADGLEKKDTFKSVYQSPALFHKTEEFATPPVAPIPPVAPNPTDTTTIVN